ncbi:MAG: FecR family protein [Ginsengibacter sp.]
MNNIQIDILLVTKYLAGEATPEEAIAIGHWIKEPANKKQFDEISSVWNLLPQSSIHKSPDHAIAWSQLQNSISKKRSFRKMESMPRVYAAAAVVAGIIICGVIFYNVFNNHTSVTREFITLAASRDLLKDTLPDGSIIILNRNSSVQYPQDFNKTNRLINLHGEAYFNIAPDKKNPFIINEGELNIKVVGTLFNVSKTENPQSIKVQVQSGIVKMYTSKSEITISKGQTGIYIKDNNVLTIKDSVDVNSMAYATGSFSFTNKSLGEISSYLEKAFGVTILFKNRDLPQCRMTAKFENKPLDYIIHVISITLNIQYTIQNNSIQIDGKACN